MDIDDILAEIDSDGEPPETRDLRELTRLWVTERSAPEVLPWPTELMDRIGERIRRQASMLFDWRLRETADRSPQTQIEIVEEQTGNSDPKANFRLIIIQTELERFKFLVRSYLRARIAKIDKYALYYLNHPDQRSKLSASEIQYSTTHQALLQGHYHASFLSQFPTQLQRLDDTAGGISMIDQPDIDKAVFVRALKDSHEPVVVEGTDTDFELRRGEIYVVRWSAVRERVLEGDAELI